MACHINYAVDSILVSKNRLLVNKSIVPMNNGTAFNPRSGNTGGYKYIPHNQYFFIHALARRCASAI